MATISLTPALRAEYERLFNTCVIHSNRMDTVKDLVRKITTNQLRYTALGTALGIPWYFIGVVHNMESSLNFSKHLHNGDPLTARTIHVPAGRPVTGNPPFTWEESARDALKMKGFGASTDWSLAGILFQLEKYNGWGYRRFHPHVLSPYLWSFSNHYISGKYVADGTWSESAVSKQCGAAVLLRRMSETDLIDFVDQPTPQPDSPPIVVSFSMTLSTHPAEVERAIALQTWLNTFPGIFVRVDGIPGNRTSEAFRKVTGSFLPGDPRRT